MTACPRRGPSTCEWQSCLGPCLLVRGSTPSVAYGLDAGGEPSPECGNLVEWRVARWQARPAPKELMRRHKVMRRHTVG